MLETEAHDYDMVFKVSLKKKKKRDAQTHATRKYMWGFPCGYLGGIGMSAVMALNHTCLRYVVLLSKGLEILLFPLVNLRLIFYIYGCFFFLCHT